mgnify:CR=1 FL=1
MRTKWNKEIVEHFLNGGTVINYDKHITLVDGTDFDIPAWLKKHNTSDTSIYAWVFSRDSNGFYVERHAFGTWVDQISNYLMEYLFPFSMEKINTSSTYNAASAVASYAYMSSGKYNERSIGNKKIFFGNGTTQPTEEDYGLESPLEKVHVTTVPTPDRLTNYYQINIKNSSEEEVTIKEVGVFDGFAANINGTNTPVGENLANTNYIMLAREVLAEPITIPAGEIGQLYIK